MPKVLQRFDPFRGIIDQRSVYGDHLVYLEDNGAPSITTFDIFQTKAVLDVGILASGAIYKLNVSYKWNSDTDGEDFEAKVIDISGTSLTYSDGYHKQEPKDKDGDWELTGSAQRYLASEQFIITGAGVAEEYTLQWRTDKADKMASIWNVVMEFKRIA